MQAKIFYLKVNGRDKKVGELTENASFVKCVQESKHLFRQGDAYGVAEEILNELFQLGCKRIILYETEKEEKWIVDFNTFMAKSWSHQFIGYERQRFLARKWWTIYDISGMDAELKQDGEKFEAIVLNEKQLKLF